LPSAAGGKKKKDDFRNFGEGPLEEKGRNIAVGRKLRKRRAHKRRQVAAQGVEKRPEDRFASQEGRFKGGLEWKVRPPIKTLKKKGGGREPEGKENEIRDRGPCVGVA